METPQQTYLDDTKREGRLARAARSDSMAEGIVGGAVIFLTAVGLLNIRPELALPVSTILIGVGFLLGGETISTRVSRLLVKHDGGTLHEEQPGVGSTAEFVTGAAGIALGLLAAFGVYPLVVVPVAAILYAGAMIFDSGLTSRLNDLEAASSGEPVCLRRVICEVMASASGIGFALGLGAAILGIISLTGMEGVRTSLGALLLLGVSSFLNGTAIAARIAGTRKGQT